MSMRWLGLFTVGGALLLAAGCRTTPPELKPPPEQEVLRPPSNEARYNTSSYPKAALNADDPLKKNPLGFGNNQAVVPARGSLGPGGGPGGMR